MRNTGHTPGPWKATEPGLITSGPNGLHIAQVATVGMGKAVGSNALLIAAAPDLLAALEGFQKAWDENRLVTSDEAAAIRAAITKAKGGV